MDSRSCSRWKCSPASETGGKQPGQFYAVHSIDTDSKGNIYTTETYDGRRLQRFNYKGHADDREGHGPGNGLAEDEQYELSGLQASGLQASEHRSWKGR